MPDKIDIAHFCSSGDVAEDSKARQHSHAMTPTNATAPLKTTRSLNSRTKRSAGYSSRSTEAL